jgi:hypothetical protein
LKEKKIMFSYWKNFFSDVKVPEYIWKQLEAPFGKIWGQNISLRIRIRIRIRKKIVDPNPKKMNSDPQHCPELRLLVQLLSCWDSRWYGYKICLTNGDSTTVYSGAVVPVKWPRCWLRAAQRSYYLSFWHEEQNICFPPHLSPCFLEYSTVSTWYAQSGSAPSNCFSFSAYRYRQKTKKMRGFSSL